MYSVFIHNRPWISPWIKSIYHFSRACVTIVRSHDCIEMSSLISNRLWHHKQNVNRASKTWSRCVRIVFLSSHICFWCHVKNKIMYVLSWRTVYALTRVSFLSRFISLIASQCRGNKHQNNTLVRAKTVRHSSTYIILYIYPMPWLIIWWRCKKQWINQGWCGIKTTILFFPYGNYPFCKTVC